MYSPIQDGIEKTVNFVRYSEAKPPEHLAEFVDNFWELKTERELSEDFYLHALPDACVNILLNQIDADIAGITALRTKYEALNLGRSFHYVGVQLLPGVWRGSPDEIKDSFVGSAYHGDLPLAEVSRKIAGLDFYAKLPVLSELVESLVTEKIIITNPTTERILKNIDTIHSVADMADVAGVSARQLQRTLKQTTGLSPHDLLKILRLQRSFEEEYLMLYTDQSHFIHSFRRITGYTPAQYAKKFDV